MTVRRAVVESLHLLDKRGRTRLLLATAVQISTSVLDLIGVLLIGLVGALAVSTIQGQASPPALQTFLDAIGIGAWSSQDALALLAGAAAILLFSKSIFSALLLRRVFIFLAGQQAVVSSKLTRSLLAQPLTFIQQRSSQETCYALVQGAGAATLLILGQAVILVSEGSLLILLGIALLLVNPIIAMSSILFFAAVAVILQFALGTRASNAGRRAAEADISSWDAIQGAIDAYREITVTSRRSLFSGRVQALRWDAARASSDLQFISLVPKYVFEIAFVVGGFVLAAFLFSTQDSMAAIGMLALFLAAATRVMPSILRLQGAAIGARNSVGLAMPTLELANQLQGAPTDHQSDQDGAVLAMRIRSGYATFSPKVEVDKVTVVYPGSDTPALREVSLSVQEGASVALVGRSGAGKSTLADTVLGVLQPNSGCVKVSGIPVAEALAQWPGAIAYVPQDVLLANGTIRGNVALGLPDELVDDDLVWDALRRAHLAEFLMEDREGLDTVIGERGLRMSGGQRQRLGIARALYARPRLLVLDEATSSLDAETELAIGETLRDLEGSVTTIVIAHRLSTIKGVDEVLYLDSGSVLASGTFEEVRATVPEFDRQARVMGLA